jgi:hypothetical protein
VGIPQSWIHADAVRHSYASDRSSVGCLMAGDWIKMRVDLLDDPAVILISDMCKIDEYGVVGRLHKLWSWADRHTLNGNGLGVTSFWVDRYIDCERFAEAMLEAGWLSDEGGHLSFPKFETHNGETAKKRALTNKRVAEFREMQRTGNAEGNATGNAPNVTESVTREEKRREEITSKATETIVSGATPDFLNGHSSASLPNCPHEKIIALYRELLPSRIQPKTWDSGDAAELQARWKATFARLKLTTEDEGLAWFRTLFESVSQSSFLMGKAQADGRKPFRLRLQWITKRDNFKKIVEGFYE